MRRGIKTGIVVALTGIVLSGCATSREYFPGMMFGTPRVEEQKKPNARFFVGREFHDRNKNKRMDDGDGYYSDTKFSGADPIMVIADVEGTGELKTSIWKREKNGVSKLVKSQTSRVNSGGMVPYSFTAEELKRHPRGGVGEYTVEWEYDYGDSQTVTSEKRFNIEW